MAEAPAIGIDLGTAFSCVGVFQHGKVEIIANDHGNRKTPSYVAFTDIERLIGDSAKRQVAKNPSNTIFRKLLLFKLNIIVFVAIALLRKINYFIQYLPSLSQDDFI